MKKNYNWAKATLVMGCMLGLGWLATPVMALDRDVRLMDEDTTIMVVAEVQPEFNGNLNQWIGENVQYPEEAYANQIDGRVFVTFVIEKDGVVSHVRVVRSAHPPAFGCGSTSGDLRNAEMETGYVGGKGCTF